MKNYHRLDEIQKDLYQNKVTCKELVEHYLANISAKASFNAFVEVYANEAIHHAETIDLKVLEKKAGPLAGLVFGIKDLICYKNHKVSASSNLLNNFESQITATAVQKLIDADAILIGRQNCDEFGMGSSNENSIHGPAKNPIDPTRVPGGSSGGSAIAVQADMCQIALGSDTGGSVRQPAAFCGIIGLKPTYSHISRYGLIAYASSFDTIGIFSKSIEDNALVLATIAGRDPKDATSSKNKFTYQPESSPRNKKYKFGFFEALLSHPEVQKEVRNAYKKSIMDLQNAGHYGEAIAFPYLDEVLPTYYLLTTAEASSNLARYNGTHFGYRSARESTLEEMHKNSRSEGFGSEVKKRIMLGTFVLSADYYDAYFTQAQKVRRLIKEATLATLANRDFLLTPTTPTTAFLHNEKSNPLSMYMADLFTVQASICGIPAISIPIEKDQKNMPIGLQIMSAAFTEEKLFAISKIISDLRALN